ncbi:hypothetical protein TSUD_233540 [Trifolium subterraneum]|uniref:Cupin type-1 domain-containing protein n=1 Tax=Trifolium subterraneum TaxID=3900 RepID=A0A2Z6M471_TRISU|nr:hypothetical protein TSUD_233540 [Trifolium subterraneum]
MEPQKSFLASKFLFLLIFFLITISLCELNALSSEEQNVKSHKGPVVKRDQRRTLVDTEYGEISATDVKEGHNKSPNYHIQFFTLEPNSVFLPVLLQAAMVFYVHTGSGKLSWSNEDGTGTTDIHEGDVGSLKEGSVFYIHSNLEAQRKKLRIYAIFTNTDDSTFVPEDLIEAITNKTETPAIVHAGPEKKHNNVLELEGSLLKYFTGIESNSKKLKTYNIFDSDPDFENCYGWTSTVTKKQLKRLKSHNIGVFMVNLTRGSMLGPHWNPLATEVAVVLEGEGMVRVVGGSNNDDESKNQRFRVKQGDVFVVSKFHPMAQMSFNNEPLVFMGFSTAAKKNHPQFLAGKESVLQILDKQIVATSLGVSKITIDKLLEKPDDSIIFECSSCAEEEEKLMEEEKEKEREEEEKRKREEEEEDEKRREKEEEEKEKEREEEEKRKREEEEEDEKRREKEEEEEKERERREKEEEEVKRREEERKREEEEARRQQEERERRRREEEEARKEEEARREQEEIRRRKEKEREEEAEREEAEAREQREKREEAEREEEEARRQQEKREKKEEEARREKEREEEEARREVEEETRKQQKKRERKEEEARREKEREEEEALREMEEEARKQQERREKRRKEEIEREKERKREEAESEEEAARRQQEKRERRRQESEARTEEERRETEEQEDESESQREGRRRQKGGDRERISREEASTEWEEAAAKRQQEERERKREQDSESSFEGRRILKIRKSV